jgi:phage baseplate assembly protein W
MVNAIKFPDMIGNNNQSNIVYNKDATGQNVTTLLKSVKRTLLGDPYFGCNLQRLLFESNNHILRDLVIDEILQAIITFVPQIFVNRKSITVTSDGNTVYVNIKAKNILDYGFEEYNINLLNVEEM